MDDAAPVATVAAALRHEVSARTLARRAGAWGAGPDGEWLAWGRAPLTVHSLGGASAAPRPTAGPRPAARPSCAPAPAPTAVDPDLEAAVAFATDLTVDLLTTSAPWRQTSFAARLVGRVLHPLRAAAHRAARWGSGDHGARLAWNRPVPPTVHRLTLPAEHSPTLRHRAPEDEPVPLRELPSTPTTTPPTRGTARPGATRTRLLRLATCSPRDRNSPAPSGWSPRRTGSPVRRAWRPSRPVATRSTPRSLRVSPSRSSSRTSTARVGRCRSSSPGARGQPPVRGSPSSSPVRA